ncbi:DUF2231 domain-containing protein [Actinoplanes derwentensis]|uniref:DUF2231 domain-containing protein n=1 Tax=Actinoplanes derwentensis TaxID=113562 RepID=A0A1H2D076_9ACTN|nr:DUF2231 domain-containing protein [Actinoplanes derwentensis]GID85879.1 hypothetical protein Ade03nite_48030 [Actinoplanes derwentensis]SDT76178.1 hypothetical protein SAMN04489716_7536 [Actinoplanes derwentensis]
MLDQINGLPVHILVLHAAVIFVPLLGLGAIVYGFATAWRPKIGWAVALLAVTAPVAAVITKLSGTEFYNRLLSEESVSPAGKVILDGHMQNGTTTMLLTIALGVVSLVLVALTARNPRALPKIADLGLALVLVVLAALSAYYLFETGDSGATAVWGTY